MSYVPTVVGSSGKAYDPMLFPVATVSESGGETLVINNLRSHKLRFFELLPHMHYSSFVECRRSLLITDFFVRI